jgi:hypothetical protein
MSYPGLHRVGNRGALITAFKALTAVAHHEMTVIALCTAR